MIIFWRKNTRQVGEQYADTLITGKINYDEEPQLIERFGIDTIPTLMLFKDGEVLVCGMHISPYEKGNIFNKDPLRPKKLLMHKSEIRKLVGKIAEQGYTLVPVEVYFKGSLVKVQIALAKGKKLYDKRQDIAKKDMKREMERDLKSRSKDF